MTRRDRDALLQLRQALFAARSEPLVAAYHAGEITSAGLERALRDELKGLYTSAYLTGRNAKWQDMTFADWGRLGNQLRTQYRYLRGLSAGLERGEVSPGDLSRRLSLFAASSRQAMEAAHAAHFGVNPAVLPAFPGDGTTLCRVNCKCRWEIRTLSKSRGDYDAYWRLAAAEHCRTCRARASAWNPVPVRRGLVTEPVELIFD